MTTGSGLDGQLGVISESAWGTALTVTRFPEINSESLNKQVTWLEPESLRVGMKAKRVSRIKQARTWVEGDIEFDVVTLGMGLFVKHMLGSTVTTPTLIAGSAYKQVHTPGDYRGLGLTVQVGRPEPSGTVRPFTYAGCKVLSWEFSISDSEYPKLKLTLDGKSENTATALATASYLAGAAAFDFSQVTLKLGGTATTASGETTIAGGTTVATIVKEFMVSGETPMDTERFGLGNAGLKSEPLENGTPTYTGSLGAEFNRTELYDLYANNTTTALQMDMTGALIGGGNNFLFSVIMPAVKLKSAAPSLNGPEVVQMSTDYEVYNDETNPTVQIKIVSTESSAI